MHVSAQQWTTKSKFRLASRFVQKIRSNRRILQEISFFQSLTGKEFSLKVKLTDKVRQVKDLIEAREGLPSYQQRLIIRNLEM